MRWGRGGRSRAQDGLADVDGAYDAYVAVLERFRGVLDELERIAAEGTGVPARDVRRQVVTARSLLAANFAPPAAEFPAALAAARRASGRPDTGPATRLLQDLHVLTPMLSHACVPLESLRDVLLERREELRPVRARLVASLGAAEAGLARGGPLPRGRDALEARLSEARDRWRFLDAGGFVPTPDRSVLQAYEDLEARLAALREDIASARRP